MNDQKFKVYIAGKGMIFELGEMTKEEYEKFKRLSTDEQKKIINKIIKETPEGVKTTLGYCKKLRKHVTMLQCIDCANLQGMSKIAEWEACKKQFLTKP